MSITKRYLESLPEEEQNNILGLPPSDEEWTDDAENEPTLVYHDGEILEIPTVDKWTERDEAVLVRPQGHCVSIRTADGTRWEV